jgi:hypothetical protein
MRKREDETGEYSFDGLAKGVADGSLSRSKALKAGGAAIFGGLLSIFALPSRDADAARRRRLPKTLWAVVNADGTLVRGKGVTDSIRATTGFYHITFVRNVSGCAYSASTNGGSPGDVAPTNISQPAPQVVLVFTYNSAGTPADLAFQLVVNC